MIKVSIRNLLLIAVLAVTIYAVPHARERVVGITQDILSTIVVRPLVEVWHVVMLPIRRITNRVRLFWEIEPLYIETRRAYEQLVRENIIAQSTSMHARECSSFSVRYAVDHCAARVILREYTGGAHRCMIDVGSLAGVTRDLPIVHDISIVGKIIAVMPLYSLVQCISDQHMRIPVRIGASGARGIFEGTGDLSRGRIAYVSHLETVNVGDIAITAGDGYQYPEGFGVARVTRVEKDGFTYRIDAEILAPIASLNCCAVFVAAQIPNEEMVRGTAP